MHWPWDRFELFKNAALRRELRKREEFVGDVVQALGISFSGKKDAFKKFSDELNDIADYDL